MVGQINKAHDDLVKATNFLQKAGFYVSITIEPPKETATDDEIRKVQRVWQDIANENLAGRRIQFKKRKMNLATR